MFKLNKFAYILLLLNIGCRTGNLIVVADLPNTFKEVSGTETTKTSNLVWMVNDSGNAAKIYGMQTDGTIVKEIRIKANNNDWEDLTTDSIGNLYIGDFGNNNKTRNHFKILKVNPLNIITKKKIIPKIIGFNLPNTVAAKDFEAFFLYHNHFYIFSKGTKKTTVFKVPNREGNHLAKIVSKYNFGSENNHITSADISEDGKFVVLLNHDKLWKLSHFTTDNFFSGKLNQLPFAHHSQKEAICFKNKKTLYITDETSSNTQGNLYEFALE